MQTAAIRRKYLEFFTKRGHAAIPSAPLVPQNDPTTLFTGSGMQPLVPYLLGKHHPVDTRLVDSQKCFRAMDIEEVGDNRHTTFFEMLGNWSLGDYFKDDQLRWLFEFLTDEEDGIGLKPECLYVTAFIGDPANNIPRDDASAEIWKKLFAEKGIEAATALIGSEENGYRVGMKSGERIFFYDAKKNWWSRSGMPDTMPAGEPGGPDSEIFYRFDNSDHTLDEKRQFGEQCHPNCDCGRFLEIGNSVFMEYIKNPDGTFGKLPKHNVDFGGGLERIAAAAINSSDIFKTDAFASSIKYLEDKGGKNYDSSPEATRAFRIVADHSKAATFLIADGVKPGNTERAYLVRRLLRRALRFCDVLNVPVGTLSELSQLVIKDYEDWYTDLRGTSPEIKKVIDGEETKFRETLAAGLQETRKIPIQGLVLQQTGVHQFDKGVAGQLVRSGNPTGKDLFILFTTYGIPPEVSIENLQDFEAMLVKSCSISPHPKQFWEDILSDFHMEMARHREVSGASSGQKFKGGLADTAEATVRLHTAHHLLLRALQIVLGPEVHQRGSNITKERLRIDFSYPQKLTEEQKKEVERIVNEKIEENLPVIRSELSREEAERLGAEHEFGQKYPERVSVYSIGPQGATLESPNFAERFSIEFCGGPHVSHTNALAEGGKKFKIQKEEAVAAGIRRIKAVLE